MRFGRTKDMMLLGEGDPSAERVNGCTIARSHERALTIQHRGPFGGIYTTTIEADGARARVTGGMKAGLFGTRFVPSPGVPPPRHVRALKLMGFTSFETPFGDELPTK